jgi:[acyl-carrier-protein] S-malonyltransferase
VLVIVAPGLGAQTPGFLSPWLELPDFTDRLRWLSAVAQIDLIKYGTEADAETIRDTAIAQPLLVASGLVSALALFPHPSDAFEVVGAVAGHSVGELTAAAGAGAITAEQAMVLVRERGKAMAVAAGTHEQLGKLRDDPPEGVRLDPLSVATLEAYARVVSVQDPRTRVISNADGAVVHNGRELLDRIVRQVSASVRWDLCMRAMKDLGVTAVIEVPPAGTLTGLIMRALPGVEALALKTPDDLPAARRIVDEHGAPSPLTDTPTWRLVVAPFAGTFRAGAASLGAILEPGQTVGAVMSRRDEQPVRASCGGTIVEWLVEDGDPVSPGQPLVRLYPEVVPA